MDTEEAKYWFDKTSELSKFNKHKSIVNQIKQQTEFLPNNSSLPQRLFHIIHQTDNIPGCKTCGDPVSWDHRYKRYKTYCGDPACPGKDPDIIQQKKEKTDYTSATEKRKQTNLERYGHTNYLATEKGKEQTKHFLVEYKDKLKQVREHTCLEKYGVKNVFELEKVQENNKQTKIHKYGSLSNNNRKKSIQTCLEKYGVPNPTQTHLQPWIDDINNTDWLIEQHTEHKKTFEELSKSLGGIDPQALIRRVKKLGVPIQRFPVSQGEKHLSSLLTNLNIPHTTNDRSIIPPYELDIYIPERRLAVEYCGLYWHSEQKGKGRSYHKTKWEQCDKHNIQLITLYEDEWVERQQQVISKLKSLLNVDDRGRIYARNTTIVSVSTSTKRNFLNQYHLQGDGPGSITYGLLFKDQLVACVTFIKQQKNIFALNRYATSCHVVGGFSKLLKHFQRHYEWKQLISFADLRWSDGNLYETTGWTLDKILPPDYYYSPDGVHRYHKFNYRRKFLPNKLVYFDEQLSEKQNCDMNGILRIWDCGKKRFIINKH